MRLQRLGGVLRGRGEAKVTRRRVHQPLPPPHACAHMTRSAWAAWRTAGTTHGRMHMPWHCHTMHAKPHTHSHHSHTLPPRPRNRRLSAATHGVPAHANSAAGPQPHVPQNKEGTTLNRKMTESAQILNLRRWIDLSFYTGEYPYGKPHVAGRPTWHGSRDSCVCTAALARAPRGMPYCRSPPHEKHALAYVRQDSGIGA